MAAIDVVARLQLRAEQFSSETGSRFAEMKARARSAAQEVRDSFGGAFAEVQKLAQTALVLPRNAQGSLDLSQEIAQLKASATASDQRAQASREMAIALNAASTAAGVDRQQLLLEADAAGVVTLAEERAAQAIRDRIVALEAVQTELNRTTSQTERNTAANATHVVSVEQQRQSTMMLGQQVQDFFVQVANGGNIGTAFSQQIGQASFALQGMGGKLAVVAEFLSSGLGIAATVAVVALVPLIGKLMDTTSAIDDATAKLKKDADETALAARAKEHFAATLAGVEQMLRQNEKALTDQATAYRSLAEKAELSARSQLKALEAGRAQRALALQDTRDQFAKDQAAVRSPDPNRQFRLQQAPAAIAALENSLARIDAAIALAQGQLNQSQLEQVAAVSNMSPIEKLNRGYDDLVRKATQKAIREHASTDELKKQVDLINARRDVAVRAEQEKERELRKKPRKEREVALGDQLEAEQGQRLLNSAANYRGLNENRDNSSLRDLFSKANEHIDPKITAWCAAFVNAVLATNGLPGTANLSARSFLGYGTATDKPQQGDIVVSRRGTGNQGHVGFYEGVDAKGNIRVLGGNTGDQVATQTVKRSDVLGFRRAPSAADSYKAEEEAAKRLSDLQRKTSDDIARINAQWDDQPRLIDRARLETQRLNEIIEDLKKQSPSAAIDDQIAAAQRAKAAIQDGLNRPFEDYVRYQRESLAIGQLSLQGRDAEAAALSDALRLQRQMGPLTDAQLGTIIRIAEQQQRISDAIEDQRRIIGLYSGAVGEVQQSFDGFLNSLRTKPGAAISGLASGIVSSFTGLQDRLFSEQLFGGMQRDIERYVAQQTGGTTPEDMLKQQLSVAGNAFSEHSGNAGRSLDDFSRAVRDATDRINSGFHSVGGEKVDDALFAKLREGNGVTGSAANDNAPIIDALTVQANAAEKNTASLLSASEIYNRVGSNFITRLEALVGVKLPATVENALKNNLGTVLQGVAHGQLGGSIFSSITGGKNDPLASGIGGALGEKAGKALEKPITAIFGKALGGFAGPLGGIVGGVLGNVLGGLFSSPKWSNASVTLNQWGSAGGTQGSGNGGAAIQAATGAASSVAAGINTIAEQLGATIKNLPALTLGTFDGKYRVATTQTSASLNYNNFGPDVLHNFDGDQQAAIEYAVRYSIANSVVEGISKASQQILKAGGDLQSAITKALLIEAVPRDLKAALDPVGAAIDALNLKWRKTIAALEEGGATTEQMAQAQQLYKIQLDQVKNSTSSASATLKDFQTSLKSGSGSTYSLRDQESITLAALKPFLDQINSGASIDQSKYQQAAQAYLDVERQLYGSTQGWFDKLDMVQAATSKAIAAIDNAVPITPGIPDPFTKATAAAAQTANEIADTQTALMQEQNDLLRQLLAKSGIAGYDDFIGLNRSFAA